MQLRREMVGDKKLSQKSRKLTRANMYFYGGRKLEKSNYYRYIPVEGKCLLTALATAEDYQRTVGSVTGIDGLI